MTGPPGTHRGLPTCRSGRICSALAAVRSELIYLLVSLDKQYTAEAPGEPWETYYAREITRRFQPSGS